jgi:hypothetical protein
MAGLVAAIYAPLIGPHRDDTRSAWEDGRLRLGRDEECRRRDVSLSRESATKPVPNSQ